MLKIILPLIIIAISLRTIFIFQGSVSFHYDMARDAFVAKQIWQDHELKLLGPPTSTPGLFHGVFYYYLIAPFYFLGQGDPRVVAIFLSFLNSLTIIPVVLLSYDLFKSKSWVYLSGLLFALSFETTQYAAWISNPSPAMLTVGLFFYFLRVWQKGKVWGLYAATLMAVVSTQFQFFLIYLFVLLVIFATLFKIKTKLPSVLKAFAITSLGLASFLLSAIKFNSFTQILGGFLNISQGAQIDFRPQFDELLINYLNKLSDLFTYNFIPLNVFLGGLIAIAALYVIRKEYFILFCLLSNLPIFIFGGHTNTYANIGLVVPAILGVIMLLKNIGKFTKAGMRIILILIFISNIYAIFKNSPSGQIILVIPNDMNLKNELSLIDQTYQLAEGQPFTINSLTLPLWTNTTWAYLYSWYGKNKYGYVPSYLGHDQVGLLGADLLPKTDKPEDITFFIIEPHVGIPEDRYQWEIGAEDSRTKLREQFVYGELKLQFRIPKSLE